MAEQTLKEKTAKGLLWGGLNNSLILVCGTVFGILLLRLLDPADYGRIAVLLIFSTIASSLQESGFMAALVNKKDATHDDYNAVFWFNIMVSTTVYAILFFASPLIADFYHDPTLTPLARYLFLTFIFASTVTAKRAYMIGHLMVKKQSLISLSALITSNVIGVIMAWQGFGYWALATQTVAYVALNSLGCWFASPWTPSFQFNLRPAWEMFGFSSKLLLTNLFGYLNTHVFSVILGRYYDTYLVGQYSNARKWNDMCLSTINGMMNSVSQPVLAQVRDDRERYSYVFRKMLRFVCFVSFPCLLGMGFVSREFILIVVGEKWLDSAILLSMLSVHGAFAPITQLYSNLTISHGNSGVNMLNTILLCIAVWVGLIALHPYGIYVMVVFFVVINIVWLAVWNWFARRIVNISYLQMLCDILPFLLLTLATLTATYFITLPITNTYALFAAKILTAAIIYVGAGWLSGAKIVRESLGYLLKRKIN